MVGECSRACPSGSVVTSILPRSPVTRSSSSASGLQNQTTLYRHDLAFAAAPRQSPRTASVCRSADEPECNGQVHLAWRATANGRVLRLTRCHGDHPSPEPYFEAPACAPQVLILFRSGSLRDHDNRATVSMDHDGRAESGASFDIILARARDGRHRRDSSTEFRSCLAAPEWHRSSNGCVNVQGAGTDFGIADSDRTADIGPPLRLVNSTLGG